MPLKEKALDGAIYNYEETEDLKMMPLEAKAMACDFGSELKGEMLMAEAAEAPENDVYMDEFAKCAVKQVKKRQAAKRAKKAML